MLNFCICFVSLARSRPQEAEKEEEEEKKEFKKARRLAQAHCLVCKQFSASLAVEVGAINVHIVDGLNRFQEGFKHSL